MSSKGSTLLGCSGRPWNNVAKESLPQSIEWFSPCTEAMAKLPEERKREYIYDLLQKVKVNISQNWKRSLNDAVAWWISLINLRSPLNYLSNYFNP